MKPNLKMPMAATNQAAGPKKSVRISSKASSANKSSVNVNKETANPEEYTDAPILPPPILHGVKVIEADLSVCYI